MNGLKGHTKTDPRTLRRHLNRGSFVLRMGTVMASNPFRVPSTTDACPPPEEEYEEKETRLDEVETQEEALSYLEGVKRRHEEGKTTRLP